MWRAEERAAQKSKRGERSAVYGRRGVGMRGWRRKG